MPGLYLGQLPLVGEDPDDEARFALKPGSLPDTTFVTEQGLKRQTVDLGWFLTEEALRYGTISPEQMASAQIITADPLGPILRGS